MTTGEPKPAPEINVGPRRIRLTPTRFGWNARVVTNLTTTEPPWWRPTKRGARRAAERYLRREQARQAREDQATEEPAAIRPGLRCEQCGAAVESFDAEPHAEIPDRSGLHMIPLAFAATAQPCGHVFIRPSKERP